MTEQPITQGRSSLRAGWPEWAKQLPQFRFYPPRYGFSLIDPNDLQRTLNDARPEIVQLIRDDLEVLDQELMRLFRKNDYEAKLQQNRYRLYQLSFLILASIGSVLTVLLALSIVGQTSPQVTPWISFPLVVVMLLGTYLVTISGREPPLQLWLSNRRRAEALRREFFRFLADLPPYSGLEGAARRMALTKRAVEMHRGNAPTLTSPSLQGGEVSTRLDREYVEAVYRTLDQFMCKDITLYYRRSIEKHRKAASQVNRIRAAALLITGIAAALAGLLASTLFAGATQCAPQPAPGAEASCFFINMLRNMLPMIAVGGVTVSFMFGTLGDLYQWDRLTSIYSDALMRLAIADALSPQPEMTDLEYRTELSRYTAAILRVMEDEAGQWGQLMPPAEDVAAMHPGDQRQPGTA